MRSSRVCKLIEASYDIRVKLQGWPPSYNFLTPVASVIILLQSEVLRVESIVPSTLV